MGLFNIIWFVFFGWWQAFVYLVSAVFFAITIIGIPLAKSLLNLAKLIAFPFGKEIVRETDLKGVENVSTVRRIGGIIINLMWFPIGLFLSITHIITGIFAFFTIIGIPVGIVLVRMGKFLLFPIGAKIVSKKEAYAVAVTNEIEKRKVEE